MKFITALLAVVVLAGCSNVPDLSVARVPTAGPIEQGPQLGTSPDGQFIRVIARPPRPGMTRTQVVQGFLDASASFDGDHAVARQFLTDEANAQWDPGASVAVYEGLAALNQAPARVTMRATQSGEILTNGRYEVSSPGTELVKRFEMSRVDGEWRISGVPQGLVLSNADIDRAFRAYSLYYFNPSFETLVPDARLIPVFGAGRATTLVKLLLAGPNAWLQPAVRTAFPDGMALSVESVPVDGGIAFVDLPSAVRLADEQVQQAMSQQLVWTLRQLPDVAAVQISSGGTPLNVPGVAVPQPRDAWPAVDPGGVVPGTSGFINQEFGIIRLTSDGSRPAFAAVGSSGETLVDFAVSRNSQELAGVDVQGQVWRTDAASGAELTAVEGAVGATGIAFDQSAAIWAVIPDRGLVAILPDDSIAPVLVLGLDTSEELIAALPSRDGTRAALTLRSGAGTILRIGRILRSAPGAPTEVVISAPIRIESRLTEVLDVAWAGSNTLLILGSEGVGLLQVFEVEIARGTVRPLGAPELPIAVAAAPGLPSLAVNSDSVVYELDAGNWETVTRGSAIAYPN
jgi:hypothetical protein